MEGCRLRPTEVPSVATFVTREPVSDSVRRLVAFTSKAQTLLELDETATQRPPPPRVLRRAQGPTEPR
jgi:hypothetical protein